MSEGIDADGTAFLKLACEMDLEGIIAKRRSAPYRSGRGGDWLKVKCVKSEGLAIIGYEPSRAALGGIGRLLLGAMKSGALVYVGGVGAGFTAASGAAPRKQMAKLVTDKPVATGTGRRKEAVWLKPVLVAEVAFRAWTDEGKLQHASFKGLREGADAVDVYEL
jgi:bifunctional non-homologous end joining protein LigD